MTLDFSLILFLWWGISCFPHTRLGHSVTISYNTNPVTFWKLMSLCCLCGVYVPASSYSWGQGVWWGDGTWLGLSCFPSQWRGQNITHNVSVQINEWTVGWYIRGIVSATEELTLYWENNKNYIKQKQTTQKYKISKLLTHVESLRGLSTNNWNGRQGFPRWLLKLANAIRQEK